MYKLRDSENWIDAKLYFHGHLVGKLEELSYDVSLDRGLIHTICTGTGYTTPTYVDSETKFCIKCSTNQKKLDMFKILLKILGKEFTIKIKNRIIYKIIAKNVLLKESTKRNKIEMEILSSENCFYI